MNLSPFVKALHADADRLGDVGCFGFNTDGVVLQLHHGTGDGITFDVNSDIHGDLLALADNHQIKVFDDLANRVALDVFNQHQLLVIGHLQIQKRIRATGNQSGLVGRDCHVKGF